MACADNYLDTNSNIAMADVIDIIVKMAKMGKTTEEISGVLTIRGGSSTP